MGPIRRDDMHVDGEGFVFIDGVKVGRRVCIDDEYGIEFMDKDKRRSRERGSRSLPVLWEDFVAIMTAGMEG